MTKANQVPPDVRLANWQVTVTGGGMDEMVTTTEAARLLHLSRRGIESAIERGRLHAERHGRRWSISVKEVERYRLFHLHRQEPVVARADTRRHWPRGGGRRKKKSDEERE